MKWIGEFAITFLFLYKTSICEIIKVEVNIGVTVDLSSLLQLRRRLLWFSLNTSYFSFIKIIRNLNETKFNLKLLKTVDSVLPKCGVQDWWDLRSKFLCLNLRNIPSRCFANSKDGSNYYDFLLTLGDVKEAE